MAIERRGPFRDMIEGRLPAPAAATARVILFQALRSPA